MGLYKIKKTFHVAYGHRLQSHPGKCRNLHGHNAAVEVTLASEKLDGGGMVMDFSDLAGKMKAWLDASLDHKVVLAADDPLVPALREAGQACFLTQGSPTAELLARLIYEAARDLGLPVSKVAFWETPSSMAAYGE